MPGKGGKIDPKTQLAADKEVATFKPAHIKRMVKDLSKMRVSKGTLKAISSGITYIILEIMDGAKNCCKYEGKKKISPRHINSAIVSDEELAVLLKHYVIQSGGCKSVAAGDIAGKK